MVWGQPLLNSSPNRASPEGSSQSLHLITYAMFLKKWCCAEHTCCLNLRRPLTKARPSRCPAELDQLICCTPAAAAQNHHTRDEVPTQTSCLSTNVSSGPEEERKGSCPWQAWALRILPRQADVTWGVCGAGEQWHIRVASTCSQGVGLGLRLGSSCMGGRPCPVDQSTRDRNHLLSHDHQPCTTSPGRFWPLLYMHTYVGLTSGYAEKA